MFFLCFFFFFFLSFFFFFFFFLMIRRPPRSTLFPYTTPSDLTSAASVSTNGFAALRQEPDPASEVRSEEHTSELQSPCNHVCRLLLEKKKNTKICPTIPDDERHRGRVKVRRCQEAPDSCLAIDVAVDGGDLVRAVHLFFF